MNLKKEQALNLFLIVSYAGIVFFIMTLIIGRGYGADWLIVDDGYGHSFSDHFKHIVYASDLKNLYFNTGDAAFPPFAYLLYRILYRVNPGSWGVDDWKQCLSQGNNMLILIGLIIVTVLAYTYACFNLLETYSTEKRFMFVGATILSAPIIGGALEQGNIAFLVTVLLIIALSFKDSENAILRETALILIAITAGLKIYPAIVGVLYLRERRWKEAIRLIIYGLIVFFVPFIFCGGIPSIIQYLKLLLYYENLGERSWTHIRNYLLSISDLLGLYERSASFVRYFKIVEKLYFLLCVISIFRTDVKWKRYLYMAGIMSLYIPFSYRYVSSYMLIPLVFFIRDVNLNETAGRTDRLYPILFGCAFTLPAWGLLSPLPADFYIFTPLYLIMIVSFCEDALERRHAGSLTMSRDGE